MFLFLQRFFVIVRFIVVLFFCYFVFCCFFFFVSLSLFCLFSLTLELYDFFTFSLFTCTCVYVCAFVFAFSQIFVTFPHLLSHWIALCAKHFHSGTCAMSVCSSATVDKRQIGSSNGKKLGGSLFSRLTYIEKYIYTCALCVLKTVHTYIIFTI